MTGGVAAGKEPLRPALNTAENTAENKAENTAKNKAESAGLNRCRRAEQGGI